MLKIYLKSYLYLLLSILILTFIYSIINYFVPISNSIFKVVITLISIIISGIILGKNVKEKAYLEALKFISPYLIISILLNLVILKYPFNYKLIIITFIYIIVSIISAMIGINIKAK